MDNDMDKYIGQLLDNRYELLEIIGTGGMSVVYKARCHRLNRFVAVKILREDLALDSEFRRRFQSESQAVAMLSHPNIVSVYDVSKSSDVEYIVMELIDGITLKQYMQKKGKLSWKETLYFAIQITKALAHAHGKGIVHRDIKPQNIMLLKDGSIKVADFGIAHLQNEQQAEQSGETMGSVHYISPEQAKGVAVDARTDIYSLGVMLYEMLTGRLPYEGENPVSVAMQHISSAPTPPREISPDIPEELEAITLKAMNSSIEDRYQSAENLLSDLESFRKSQAAILSGAAVASNASNSGPDGFLDDNYDDDDYHPVFEGGLRPLGTSGELSKEAYAIRRRRSKRVSMLSGFFCVLIFVVVLVAFLWNFWLKGIFEDAVRIEIPNFTNKFYETVINEAEYKGVYNFTVVYTIDPTRDEGIIMSQSPEAGRSLMKVEEGIDVELTVSTGVKLVEVPDVVNWEYRDATTELQRLGFVVDSVTEASESVTKDYVIGTNPQAGESLSAGSTIYLTISGGPEVTPITMPNLIGLTQEGAIDRIESNNLTLGTISPVESDLPEGTIIWQSVPAYTEVEEHTKIYLQVSIGPKETEEPSPTPTDEPVNTTEPPTPSEPVTPPTQEPGTGGGA
jgi:serine/threonine protein kinase